MKKISLTNNMIIYSIGIFFTKILNFIVAPIYTYFLSTAEYGAIDVLITVGFLFIPIFTLTIVEAILKYGIDDCADRELVFTNGIIIDIVGIFAMIFVTISLGQVVYKEYLGVIIPYFILECLFIFFQTYAKSQKKTIVYSISSIIYSSCSIIASILLVTISHLGVLGYFIGICIGLLFSISFIFVYLKCWKDFKITKVNKKYMMKMIKYSAPLVLSTISFWIISSCDRRNFVYNSQQSIEMFT